MTDAIRKAAQDVLDGWDDKAVLSITYEMEVLRTALAAPTQAAPDTCPDCGKPAPEGSIHTCSPQKPDSDALIADGWRRCAVGQGESQHCPMAEANARDAKQRLLEIMRKNGLATGHGDTIDDALKELDWQLSELKGKSDGTR